MARERASFFCVRRREISSERGAAIMEFAISLPFLFGLIAGVFDITGLVKEYFFLTDAVSAGAKRAMVAPDLTVSTTYVSGSGPSCTGTSNLSSAQVHDRVQSLVSLQNRSLSQICIRSQRVTDPQGDAIIVQAHAHYNAFFPIFKDVQLSAQVSVPYLL